MYVQCFSIEHRIYIPTLMGTSCFYDNVFRFFVSIYELKLFV